MKKETKEKIENTQTEVATLEEENESGVEEEIAKPAEKQPKQKELKIEYFENAKVICGSCNNTFTVGSTKPEIHVEVCSNCHPFFTGQAKFVDTEGRVEAFRRREAAIQEKKEKKAEPQKPERPKSLKEMLELLQES